MKYTMDRDASAELTRLTLQKVSQYEAKFTPFSFSVWFEHLTGTNHKLNLAINELLERSDPIDDHTVEMLYRQHVSECNLETQQLINKNAQKILSNIKTHAENTDEKANLFGGYLARSVDLMTDELASPGLQAVVSELREETSNMQYAVRTLSQNLVNSQHEIEALRQQLEYARTEALTDPLTGLLNRRGFEVHLLEAAEAVGYQGLSTSLIMIDIDHFKKVNDTYGHLFGDKVIRTLAEVIKSNVKDDGVAARLGGEEFGVLLPDTGIEDAQALAEQIRQKMARGKITLKQKDNPIENITISLGVAMLAGEEEPSTFIDRADKALYASKQNGRNRVSLSLN